MAEQHIVAMGGFALGSALDDYVLEVARGPRICFLPTAMAENPELVVSFYEAFARKAEPSHLLFHPWPPRDLRDFVLAQDAVYVSGGNAANMLAIWRTHGLDAILREAWESGVVLAGWSAGCLCWFEAAVTDSFGPQLEALDCLGFLPGSACPHYDSEQLRRRRYRELLRDGMPPGYGIEDRAAVHFAGAEPIEVVAAEPGKRAYRVDADGETPLDTRELR